MRFKWIVAVIIYFVSHTLGFVEEVGVMSHLGCLVLLQKLIVNLFPGTADLIPYFVRLLPQRR